jgi:uncharacterized membrane protein
VWRWGRGVKWEGSGVDMCGGVCVKTVVVVVVVVVALVVVAGRLTGCWRWASRRR